MKNVNSDECENESDISIKRKKMIEEVMKSNHIQNKALLFRFLYDGTLDSYIDTLDDVIVDTLIDSFVKKRYFTSEEQFLSIVDNFISYFMNIISNNIVLMERVFSVCIRSSYADIFFSKKYFFDNDNLDYYYHYFGLIVISNFYNNLLFLKEDLQHEFGSLPFDVEEFNIEKEEDVRKIVKIVHDICFINLDSDYMLLSMFNKADSSNKTLFLNHYDILISNYTKKYNFIIEYDKMRNNIEN